MAQLTDTSSDSTPEMDLPCFWHLFKIYCDVCILLVSDRHADGKKQQRTQRERHQRPPHKMNNGKKIRKTEVNVTSVISFV